MTEHYRSLLPKEGQELYPLLLAGLNKCAREIRIPPTEGEAVNAVLRAVLADHPELPWFAGAWGGAGPRFAAVRPRYVLGEAERLRFQQERQRLAAAAAKQRDRDPLARLRWAYEQLLYTVRYDETAAHSQTAYGALVEGRALCRGIAKGLQLLLDCCGLDAALAEGSLDGRSYHVWNLVFLDKGPCHVDVTMGFAQLAPLWARSGRPWDPLAGFCLTDRALRGTHLISRKSLPVRCDYEYRDKVDRETGPAGGDP